MFQWALAGSSLIGGILASISFPLVMWLSVIPAIVGLFIALKITEPKVHYQKTTNIYAHLKEALTLFWQNPQ